MSASPQRKKYLVHGYIKSITKMMIDDITDIILVCLLFADWDKDEIDTERCHERVEIDATKQKATVYKVGLTGCSIYFTNKVSMGIHIWRFKFTKPAISEQWTQRRFGILNNKYNTFGTWPVFRLTQYALASNGWTKSTVYGRGFDKKFTRNISGGSIIEMILDMNQLTLSYIINDKDKGSDKNIAFKIEPGKYSAIVSLTTLGDSIELLSYRDICNQ